LPKHNPGKKLNIDPNDLQPLPYIPYPSAQNKKFAWPNLSEFGEYAAILTPHLARLGTIFSNKPDRTIWAKNPYVASDYGKYIDAMLRNKIDNSQQLKEIEKAGRANAYMIN
jgi:hypothetical protein